MVEVPGIAPFANREKLSNKLNGEYLHPDYGLIRVRSLYSSVKIHLDNMIIIATS
jgi:hypothetical protein